MTEPQILVAMPVYKGEEVVAETLRSVRDQMFTDYRLLIGVDANDEASAEVCRSFAAKDSRIEVVVHPHRLGWAANFNWLVQQCDCPFFCYWQQDDLCSTNYLENLLAELRIDPDAAIAYADIQWFGKRFCRESSPSTFGTPIQRMLEYVELSRYEALRGVIRAAYLPREEPIRLTSDEGTQLEYVFLLELAARGAFRRVADAMYFKRAHAGNTHKVWYDWPEYRRRRAWIDMGIGFLTVLGRMLPEPRQRRHLLACILDRLTIFRTARNFYHKPSEESVATLAPFVRDLIARAGLALDPDGVALDSTTLSFSRPVHPFIESALRLEEQAVQTRRDLAERLRQQGQLALEIRTAGDGLALLGFGWSGVESWGVWNDGDEATLWLPPAGFGPWRIALTGHHFGQPGTPVRVLWRVRADEAFRVATLPAGTGTTIDLAIANLGSSDSPRTLQLRLPDSVFLPSIGSPDSRQLGFGLRGVCISRLPVEDEPARRPSRGQPHSIGQSAKHLHSAT